MRNQTFSPVQIFHWVGRYQVDLKFSEPSLSVKCTYNIISLLDIKQKWRTGNFVSAGYKVNGIIV